MTSDSAHLHVFELSVLVVDDHEAHGYIAKRQLLELGCTDVDLAGNGLDALKKLSVKEYSLVLMDLEMDGMDGLEATRRIRAGDAGPGAASLSIVALTGIVHEDARQLCLDAGMDDFLAKPCDINELARVLRRFLPHPAPPTPLSSANSTPALEFSSLPRLERRQALAHMGGDEEIYKEMWAMTLQECPEKLRTVACCLEAHDTAGPRLKEAGRHAHQLKSLFRTIGAQRAAACALELETAAKEGRADQAANAFAALEEEIMAVLREGYTPS